MKSSEFMRSLLIEEKELVARAEKTLKDALVLLKEQPTTFFLLCKQNNGKTRAVHVRMNHREHTLRELVTKIIEELQKDDPLEMDPDAAELKEFLSFDKSAPQMYAHVVNLSDTLISFDQSQLGFPLWFLFGPLREYSLHGIRKAITSKQNLLLSEEKTILSHDSVYEYAVRRSCIRQELVREQPNGAWIEKLIHGLTHLDCVTPWMERDDPQQISKAGLVTMAHILETNTSLVWLALQISKLELDSAQALANALRKNNTLTALGINANAVELESIEILEKALDANITLLELNYSCPIFVLSSRPELKASIQHKLRRNRRLLLAEPLYWDLIRLFLVESDVFKGAVPLCAIIVSYLTFDSGAALSCQAVGLSQENRNLRLLEWLPSTRLSTPPAGDIKEISFFQKFVREKKDYKYDHNIMQLVFKCDEPKDAPILARSLNAFFVTQKRQKHHQAYIRADDCLALVVRGISLEDLQRLIQSALQPLQQSSSSGCVCS